MADFEEGMESLQIQWPSKPQVTLSIPFPTTTAAATATLFNLISQAQVNPISFHVPYHPFIIKLNVAIASFSPPDAQLLC